MDAQMLKLYAKALVHKPYSAPSLQCTDKPCERVPVLPNTSLHHMFVINPFHCSQYNKLCKWSSGLAAIVHPNYIQTLSLPLQLEMMVSKYFPFSPMGMVHIANQIKVTKLPNQSDDLVIYTKFGNVYFHKKGWLFEVITSAFNQEDEELSQPLVHATSVYLAKAKHTNTQHTESNHGTLPEWLQCIHKHEYKEQPDAQAISFASNVGRQYAKVSGDYNPIHLHPFSARLFGFEKAIAHGMFSKALAVSGLARQYRFYDKGFEIVTLFKQAISLPGDAIMNSQQCGSGTVYFSLDNRGGAQGKRKERSFMQGTIRY